MAVGRGKDRAYKALEGMDDRLRILSLRILRAKFPRVWPAIGPLELQHFLRAEQVLTHLGNSRKFDRRRLHAMHLCVQKATALTPRRYSTVVKLAHFVPDLELA
jgi:hypothetical protein